jgi:phosphate transport system permease protein
MVRQKGIISRRYRDLIAERAVLIPAILVSVILIAMVIVFLDKASPIFITQPITTLLFSSSWHPLSGQFGFFPFIAGTVWVTLLAMGITIPISILSAVYLAEYAHRRVRGVAQPLIDLLAGIPSVVFGLFGILLIVPLIKEQIAPLAGVNSSGYCVLAGGLVLAIMVFPIVISISYEVIRAVPTEMREAALALGATRWETVKFVVLRKALTGIIAAIILGFSRAFGETMAVLMVVGNVPIVPQSVFDPAYPIPALIANNYGEMMSIPAYDSALMFAALILFVIVVAFNILARIVLVRVYRKGV